MLQSTLGKQIQISLAEADDDDSVLVDPVKLVKGAGSGLDVA